MEDEEFFLETPITWTNRRRKLVEERKNWAKYSNCVDLSPSDMYPETNVRQAIVIHNVCRNCPTQKECLVLGLVFEDEFGVWGGTSERDRRLLFKVLKEEVPNLWEDWSIEKENFLKDFAFVFVEEFYLMYDIDPNSLDDLRLQREKEYLEGCYD
jgi:WhiB family redox-sensing transcriptional regulator